MSVSAKMVMQLRERTGSGMMECKKFLVATNGDIEQAIIEMRKAGQAKADKKADRIAAEGIIVIKATSDNRRAVMLEVNSETEFVAQTALDNNITTISALSNAVASGSDRTIEQARQELVAKIGENIQLRRLEVVTSEGVIGSYIHSNRIGV